MSDKQVKVAKPERMKPQPVKPEPTKPTPISVPKAQLCIRCTNNPQTTRAVCAPCDKALQDMHWNLEHQLFRRTVYIPEVPHDDGPSLNWLMTNGYAEHIRKPPRPYFRPKLRDKTSKPLVPA